ncbi:hypothetical protein ACWT_6729 [Actinoplanes sp. SE50]|uniref:DUF1684 domain-containing protein n=1 Tax=unclassified Actinoplanes TaxID=2626549 RepID=UPI00023ECD93|nr:MULTISPECIES: DUF1684 domain-containing protein [unclassified Actinoplanes]AEV87742.1 hypothetical protein ACPL_6860 [Actinoplanes sp. SE50/110]ATO86144.1 hypothetical protein ACWT_6729 [Actinoplanes sp. SE50]SLM03558.1 hypothetical protein ACSP50_6851 [Actinoplanes sp. SE50/110]
MEALELADFRAAVARMYLEPGGLSDFRRRRDELFAGHPQSPIPADERAGFAGLSYFPPNDDLIVEVPVREADGELTIDTGGPDGAVRYRRAGILETPFGELTLWWIAAYGGGLFLPVRDTTCGTQSYGGGRYLTDTVKGTHGRGLQWLRPGRVRLDFNYLYNPSCAYDPRWACPLAPPENRLAHPLAAGEHSYH